MSSPHRLVAGAARHLRGWRRDRPRAGDPIAPVHPLGMPDPPRAVDLRSWCGPVLDQGELGSCTAHAAVGAVHVLYRRAGLEAPALSTLALYYHTRVDVEGAPAGEDGGAELRDAMRALERFGVCRAELWPYLPERLASPPPPDADRDAAGRRARLYLRLPTLDATGAPSIAVLRHCLAQGWPFAFGFEAYQSLQSEEAATTGLVRYPAPGEAVDGGHAVLAVGYDDDRVIGGDTGAICFRNSWGPSWGDGGCGWLPYRYFTDMLADDCWSLRAEGL